LATYSASTLKKLSASKKSAQHFDLSQRGDAPNPNISKGWQYLPTYADANPQQIAKMKTNPKIAEALRDIHNPPLWKLPSCGGRNEPPCETRLAIFKAQQQKIVDDYYHKLVVLPQIKAQEEEFARQQEAYNKKVEEEREVYATLKMRVAELEKKPTPKPTPAVTSSLPIIPIIIIAVIVGFFLLRRRA